MPEALILEINLTHPSLSPRRAAWWKFNRYRQNFCPLPALTIAMVVLICGMQLPATAAVPEFEAFKENHCIDCHDSETQKGGLDLSGLQLDPTDGKNFGTWVKIHDRVAAGEMPPKKKSRPDPAELDAFLSNLRTTLHDGDHAIVAKQGRAGKRRLNRYEYEETLRDLFSLPYLEIHPFLPEDRESHGFTKVGEALDVSHVQLASYLAAADFALREAMAPTAARPECTTRRYYSWEEKAFFGRIDLEGKLNRRTFPLIGLDLQLAVMAEMGRQMPYTTEPTRREQEAMAVVVSTYEPTEIHFSNFRAPVSGKYRLRLNAYSAWMAADFKGVSKGRRNEPVTLYAETSTRTMRRLDSFDISPDPATVEIEVWLSAGETIRPDAARLFRSRPPHHINPLMTAEGMPAVAFRWLEVEGPLIEQWPPASHQLLFGDLPIQNKEKRPPLPESKNWASFTPPPGVDVISKNPHKDAARLLRSFLAHTYRRPVSDADLGLFLKLVDSAMASGSSFTEAMLVGYTAVLSSPKFLYLEEKNGPLDDLALAARLSYFLWNSRPDQTLKDLATKGTLHRPEVLRAQTERLLDDPRSQRFVNAFLDYWLDLRKISGTAPDETLYPEYQLDDLLAESMTAETQLFFSQLLRRDLPARNLLSSDFAMLNERLADHYGIPGVTGVKLRPISLPKDSLRGGLLTQASVLKVTANGTTTSPVVRGAWIMSRILGKTPPPPPPNIAAVDPDIRGATTVREQLAAHRNQESCNACHRNIDPAGFALESFDVMGGWRDRYRSITGVEPVTGVGHNGKTFAYSLGLPVDATGELWDGRTFLDIRQLKELLLTDEETIARNLIQQLAVYATGAPIHFSDRTLVSKILDDTRANGYGVRSLIHQLVQSELFLNK